MCPSNGQMLDSHHSSEDCPGTLRAPTAVMSKSSTFGIRGNGMLGNKQDNYTHQSCDLGAAADQDVSELESPLASLVSVSETAASWDPMKVAVMSPKFSMTPARPVYTRSSRQLYNLLSTDMGSTKRMQGCPLLKSPQVHDIQMKIEGPHLGDLPQDVASQLQSFLCATLGMPPLHVSVGQGCVHLVALLLDISAGIGIAGLAAHRRRRRFHGGCGAADVTSLPVRIMTFMRAVLPDNAAPVRVTVRQGERVYEIQAGTAAAAEPPPQVHYQARPIGVSGAGNATILLAATATGPEQPTAAWSSERLQPPSVTPVEASVLAPGSREHPCGGVPLAPRGATAPAPAMRQSFGAAQPTRGGSACTWGSSTANPDSIPSQPLDVALGQRLLTAPESLDQMRRAFIMQRQPTTTASSPATSLAVTLVPESRSCGSIAAGTAVLPGSTRLSCSADTGPGLGAEAVMRDNVPGSHLCRLPPTDAGALQGCSSSVSFGYEAVHDIMPLNARLPPMAPISQPAVGHWWPSPRALPHSSYSASSNAMNVLQPTTSQKSTAAGVDLSCLKRVLEHTASKGHARTSRTELPPSLLNTLQQSQQPETPLHAAAAAAVAHARKSYVESVPQLADSMAMRRVEPLAPLLLPESSVCHALMSEQIKREGPSHMGCGHNTYRKLTMPSEGGAADAAAAALLVDRVSSASSGQYGTSPEADVTNPDDLCLSLSALHNRSVSRDRNDGASGPPAPHMSYSFSTHVRPLGGPPGRDVGSTVVNRQPLGMVSPSSHGAAGDLAAGYVGNRGATSAARSMHLPPSDASGVWPPLYPPAVRASVVSTALGLSGSGMSAATARVASAYANSSTSSRSLLGAGMEQLEAMGRRLMLPMPVGLARLHSHPVTQPVELLCPAVLTWPAVTRANADAEASKLPTDWDMPALDEKQHLGSSVGLLMRCPDVIARPSCGSDGMSELADTFDGDTGSLFACRAPQPVMPSGRGLSDGNGLSASRAPHTSYRAASAGGAGRDSDLDSEVACSGHVSQLLAWNRSGAVTVMQVDDSAEGCTWATLLLMADALSPPRTGAGRTPDMNAGGKAPPMRPLERHGNQQGLGIGDVVAAGGGDTSSSGTGSVSAGTAAAPTGLAHLVYVAWRRGQSLGPPCPVLLLSAGLEEVVEELQGLQPPPQQTGTVRNSYMGLRSSSPTVQLSPQQVEPHSYRSLQQAQSQQATQQAALTAYHNFLSDLGVWLEGLQLATSSVGSATTATSGLHRSNLSMHGTSPSGVRTGSVSGVRPPSALESSALVALVAAGGAVSYGSVPSLSGAALVGSTGDDRPAAASRVIAMPASASFRTYVDRFAATPAPANPAQSLMAAGADALCCDVSPFQTLLITPSPSPTTSVAPPAASACNTIQPTSGNDSEGDERVARLAEEILGVGCDLLRHAIASGAVATAQLILNLLLTHGPRFTRLRALAAAIDGTPHMLYGGGNADAGGDSSAAVMAATRSAILRLVLETCRAANAAGQTLLHLAVMSGSLRLLQVMLEVWPQELGLSVQVLNRRDRLGRAPVDFVVGGAIMAAAGTGTAWAVDSGAGAAAAGTNFAAGAALLLDALGAPFEDDPVSNAVVAASIEANPARRWGLHVVHESSSEGRTLASLVPMHVQRVACPTSGASEQACDSGSLVDSNGADLSWVQDRNSRAGGNESNAANADAPNAVGDVEVYSGDSMGADDGGEGHRRSCGHSYPERLASMRRWRRMELALGNIRSVQSEGGLRRAVGLLGLQSEQGGAAVGEVACGQQGHSSAVAHGGSQGGIPARVRQPLWGAMIMLLGSVQALLVLILAMPRARTLPPAASLLSPPGLLLWLPCVCLITSSALSAAIGLALHSQQLAQAPWLPSAITALGRTLASTMALVAAEQLPLGAEPAVLAGAGKAAVARSGGDRDPMEGLRALVTAAGGGSGGDPFGVEWGVRMLVLTLAPAALEADLPPVRAALLAMEHVLPLVYITMYGSINTCLIWLLYAFANATCGVVITTVLQLR